jgi:hypothetical protein
MSETNPKPGEVVSDCRMTKVVEVICVCFTRGTGVINSPVREVYQLWTPGGTLIVEDDCCGTEHAKNNFAELLK